MLASNLRRGEVVVSAWRAGKRLPVDQRVIAGSLTATSGTGVRRQGQVSLPHVAGAWDLLVPGQTTLRLTWVMRFLNQKTEGVPLGAFDIVSRKKSYGSGRGTIDLAVRDLYGRVLDRGFDKASRPRGNAARVAAAYIREAIGDADLNGQLLGDTTSTVYGQVYREDRADAVKKILDSAGMEAYISRDQYLVVRRKPLLTGMTVSRLRMGPLGTVSSGDRSDSREQVVNRLVVVPDGARVWFAPFIVENTNRRSPTNVIDSPVVSRTVSDPRWRTRTAAETGARARLDRLSALESTTSVTAACDWTLDPGDVVAIGLTEAAGDDGVNERHLLEEVPLSFDGADQTFTTSTARPTADGDEVVA